MVGLKLAADRCCDPQAKKILTEAGPKAMTILDGEFRPDQLHA